MDEFYQTLWKKINDCIGDDENTEIKNAKKIKMCIEVMKDLSQYVYLFLEDRKDQLSKLKVPGDGLPEWYQSKEHDLVLLKLVKKHGFEFKSIFSDDDVKLTFQVKASG